MKESPSVKRDTKKRIFDASVELFSEKGFRETTMRDIAKKTGIKPASIYNHYASKEMIIEELLDVYLERMDHFYENMKENTLHVSEGEKLEDLLKQLILVYSPDEVEMMFRLTRVVYHEQFHFDKAAEALIGSGYRKYMLAHAAFFDRLSDAGLIRGKERNLMYAELFARVSITFAFQFLHPNVTPTLSDISELYSVIIQLIAHYEKHVQHAAMPDASPGQTAPIPPPTDFPPAPHMEFLG